MDMIFSAIAQMIVEFCGQDLECQKEINQCVDQEIWHHYEESATRRDPDQQMLIDFTTGCMEQRQ